MENNQLAQIEREAMAHFSNYGGEEFSGVDGMGDQYDGFSDALLDFDDFNGLAYGFANEVRMQRVIVFDIANTTATAQQFRLGGNIDGLFVNTGVGAFGGLITDGVCASTTTAGALTASAQPSGVNTNRVFFSMNPSRVVGFKMFSSNLNNHEGIVVVEKYSPFRKLDSHNIYLSTYRDEYGTRDSITTVKKGFNFDQQTSTLWTIQPNSSITVTLVFGAVLNVALGLRKKRAVSKRKAIKLGRPTNGFSDNE